VLIDNINVDNFLDTYMVSKGFECQALHQSLISFGT